MRRHILGAIGVAFLIGGAIQFARDDWTLRDGAFLTGVGVRVGILLLALWLALPQIQTLLEKFPLWLLATVGLGGLILVIRPRTFAFVLPIVAAVIVLQFLGRILGISRPPPRRDRGNSQFQQPDSKQTPTDQIPNSGKQRTP